MSDKPINPRPQDNRPPNPKRPPPPPDPRKPGFAIHVHGIATSIALGMAHALVLGIRSDGLPHRGDVLLRRHRAVRIT